MKILLDEEKNYYKANLHCHSTHSDGKLSVAELKEEFKKRGYSVVAFTDHEHIIDNSKYDDDDFLTLTSCEIAIKEFPNQSTAINRNMKVCHLNFYSENQHNTLTPCYSSLYDHFIKPEIKDKIHFKDEYTREYSAKGINEIIRIAGEQGFLVQYNHPAWSLENALQYLNYEGLFSIEIYNHGCVQGGYPDYNINAFDDILRSGKQIFCTMTDDCHIFEPIDSAKCDAFGGFIMINADKLKYSTIFSALKNGSFYASQGPEIHSIIVDGNTVKIKTSPAKKIAYSTAGRGAKSIISANNDLNYAEFEISDTDGYFRITVTDKYGKVAHSQAYRV